MTRLRLGGMPENLMSLRSRNEQKLFRRMEGRSGPEQTMVVLSRVKEELYAGDLAFAGWWIAQRITFKSMAGQRLWHEVNQHGVAAATAGDVLVLYTRGRNG